MLKPLSLSPMYGGEPGPRHGRAYDFAPPVDLQDLEVFARGGHPFAAYAAMREHAPVCFHAERDPAEPGFWVLTAHEDIRKVSLDTKTFSSQKGGHQITYGPAEQRHPLLFRATLDNMINLDAPVHLQLRKEHMPFFTPGYVGELRRRVEAQVETLLDAMERAGDGGPIDMVEHFSAELPLFTLSEILGVPEADRPKLVDWMHYLEVAQDTMWRFRSGQALSDKDLEFVGTFLAKVEEMFAYGRALLMARRADPKPDLLSAIANARIEGDVLSEEYLDGSWLLIVFAGNDTTRNTLSGTMKLLTENPDQKAKLLGDGGLMANFVEEAIRMVSPVIHMRRTAVADTQIRDQKIAAGEKVTLWYGAANRDPAVFPDPDRFDVTRKNAADHLAFGIGPHVCLGKRVAQMQLEAAYRAILRRFPGMAYAGGMDIAPNNFVHAIKRLPVTLGR